MLRIEALREERSDNVTTCCAQSRSAEREGHGDVRICRWYARLCLKNKRNKMTSLETDRQTSNLTCLLGLFRRNENDVDRADTISHDNRRHHHLLQMSIKLPKL